MTLAKILIGGVGFAALATATPSVAQYNYGYGQYGGISTQAAVNNCSAAVQNRLSYRGNYNNYGEYNSGRVLSITRVDPDRNNIKVRGVATSGRMAQNGLNLFGLLGSNYRADLSFSCTVDYRGRIRDVDINRR